MNTTTETVRSPITQESTFKWVAGGSMMEAIGAMATMALGVVGLAGVLSITMAGIATIVIGAAILIECGSFGGAVMAWQGSAAAGTPTRAWEAPEKGTSAEFLGGLSGIVLGILALLGVSSETLLSVAVLVFGASFLLGGMAASQTPWFTSTSSGQMLIGLGAVVLGILAVIGLSSLTLVLVGLLSLGASALFSGSAHGARMPAESHKYPAA